MLQCTRSTVQIIVPGTVDFTVSRTYTANIFAFLCDIPELPQRSRFLLLPIKNNVNTKSKAFYITVQVLYIFNCAFNNLLLLRSTGTSTNSTVV
jgi:hypothetical protein